MPNVWTPSSSFVPQAQAAGTLLYQRFVSTAAQSLYTLTSFAYAVSTGSLLVFQNGSLLTPVVDYVETSATSFTLTSPATLSDEVVAFGFVGITGTVVTGDGTVKVTGADATQAALASKLLVTSPLVASVVNLGGGVLALELSLNTSNILENTETAIISGDFQYTGSKSSPNNLATQGDLDAATSGTPTATLSVYMHNTFTNFFA